MKKRTVLAKKAIKLTVMLICLTVITTFSSCERENNHRIVGKWKITHMSTDGINWVESQLGGSPTIWCFKSNNIFVDGYGVKYPYSIDGSTILITLNNPDVDNEYGIEGTVYKISILSHTHSELTLRWDVCVLSDGIIYDYYDFVFGEDAPYNPDRFYYKLKRI